MDACKVFTHSHQRFFRQDPACGLPRLHRYGYGCVMLAPCWPNMKISTFRQDG
jgi:hypothetical protein